MVLRPATPGFAVTLAATICLALVSFGVPWLKSIYFLTATINSNGLNGTATFGVLGYCVQAGASSACSNATVGWEFGTLFTIFLENFFYIRTAKPILGENVDLRVWVTVHWSSA